MKQWDHYLAFPLIIARVLHVSACFMYYGTLHNVTAELFKDLGAVLDCCVNTRACSGKIVLVCG